MNTGKLLSKRKRDPNHIGKEIWVAYNCKYLIRILIDIECKYKVTWVWFYDMAHMAPNIISCMYKWVTYIFLWLSGQSSEVIHAQFVSMELNIQFCFPVLVTIFISYFRCICCQCSGISIGLTDAIFTCTKDLQPPNRYFFMHF